MLAVKNYGLCYHIVTLVKRRSNCSAVVTRTICDTRKRKYALGLLIKQSASNGGRCTFHSCSAARIEKSGSGRSAGNYFYVLRMQLS